MVTQKKNLWLKWLFLVISIFSAPFAANKLTQKVTSMATLPINSSTPFLEFSIVGAHKEEGEGGQAAKQL